MTQPARLLSKSRFKLGVECPTKLFYTGKSEYVNNNLDNNFLAALAEGGYQVGALACLMFEPGEMVPDGPSHQQVALTKQLLAQENITIFEAAFEFHGLFARVDVLRKRGRHIDLIEVKAKSFDSTEPSPFRNKSGQFKPDLLPYLQDIAFQRHVVEKALPEHTINCHLMMPDIAKTSTVPGLNQRFQIKRMGNRIGVDVAPGTTSEDLGAPILVCVPVDAEVAEILSSTLQAGESLRAPFLEAVQTLATAYQLDQPIPPAPGAHCAHCEFKTTQPTAAARSGFHECWQQAFGLQPADFLQGTVLDVWNFRKKQDCIRAGVIKLADVRTVLTPEAADVSVAGMTHAQRQWFQCTGEWPGGGPFYFNAAGMAQAISSWRFPLHFIDFETSVVPIPFAAGMRPYGTTAFQFSHHVMHADGRVEHRSQFLDATPGQSPNFAFVRALRSALSNDEGTVFRWATHENSVLNQLREQLLCSAELDRDSLVAFIESLTTRKEAKGEIAGPRAMVDLCKLSELHYFHPATHGSSSLKKVLPALMNSSAQLREIYGVPRYGSAQMPSLNLTEPMTWWQIRDGQVCDPYKLLPPVFADLSRTEQDALDEGMASHLQEGGAAMAAYATLQSGRLTSVQSTALQQALLRYCELDTLAMVMAVQAWTAWAQA